MKIDINSVYHIGQAGDFSQGFSFTSLAIDSRKVIPGAIFAAHKGETVDAHRFITQAVIAGATAIIAEYVPEDYTNDIPLLVTDDVTRTLLEICSQLRHARPEQYIVAVTGSNGKTTTKDICAHVLAQRFDTGATEGNLNTEWGVPYTYINNYDKSIVVIEMGMDHPGDIGRLAHAVQPDVGIVTIIAPVHMEFMHTLEAIYEGKTELFAFVRENGVRLANADNEWLRKIKTHYDDTMLFGCSEYATHRFSIVRSDPQSTEFIYANEHYVLPLWGDFNVYNAVPAIIIARMKGMSPEEIRNALKTVVLSPKRAEVHQIQGKLLINDTYNASPNAMHEAIRNCTSDPEKKVIVCMGDMLELGKESPRYHREVLGYAVERGVAAYCVGAEFKKLADEFPSGMFFIDKETCAEAVFSALSAYDIVLFKGSRGMRMEEVFTRVKERLSCSTIS